MRRALLTAAGTIALVASTAPAAGAASATFGADLAHHPANNDTSGGVCSNGIDVYGVPPGSQSCMFALFGSGSGSAGLTAPATGTVNAIRVKVGATTGRMRVNVIRFLFQQTGDTAHPTVSGPYLEAYGSEFKPKANSITKVATSLPVQIDPYPLPSDTSSIQRVDGLALEVEAPNVPIPLFKDEHSSGSFLYGTWPGPTEQGLEAPSYNAIPGTRQLSVPLGVLMNADFTTGTAAVKLVGSVVPVRRSTATIPLRCLVVACSGRVSLQNATAGARATSARTRRYGSASFRARAGRTTRVKVRLNAAGRALLRRHRKATVLAKVSFTAGRGAPKSFRVTLKR